MSRQTLLLWSINVDDAFTEHRNEVEALRDLYLQRWNTGREAEEDGKSPCFIKDREKNKLAKKPRSIKLLSMQSNFLQSHNYQGFDKTSIISLSGSIMCLSDK